MDDTARGALLAVTDMWCAVLRLGCGGVPTGAEPVALVCASVDASMEPSEAAAAAGGGAGG